MGHGILHRYTLQIRTTNSFASLHVMAPYSMRFRMQRTSVLLKLSVLHMLVNKIYLDVSIRLFAIWRMFDDTYGQ